MSREDELLRENERLREVAGRFLNAYDSVSAAYKQNKRQAIQRRKDARDELEAALEPIEGEIVEDSGPQAASDPEAATVSSATVEDGGASPEGNEGDSGAGR